MEVQSAEFRSDAGKELAEVGAARDEVAKSAAAKSFVCLTLIHLACVPLSIFRWYFNQFYHWKLRKNLKNL